MISRIKYRFLLLTSIMLLPILIVSAQYYDTGQDPASVKWLQIKTSRYTVIYPDSYSKDGEAYAKTLDQAYSKLGSLFPEKKIKIPVVIHSLTTQSNGYVAWAPKRMELYPTPEQNSIPLDPKTQLAVHELTHVFQMESLNSGFSRFMKVLLGEQFTGVSAFFLPLWFLEGDAVFAETFLTESGRGRSPSFQKQLKALTLRNTKNYTYDKSVNGSYRDFVPDQYQYGYQMVTWALAKYDHQIWNKVLSKTAKQPFTINPVNLSLLKSAHITKKKLYQETFDSLKTIWADEISNDKTAQYEVVSPVKKGKYINYYSPVPAGPDSIFAVKTSLSDPPSIILINPEDKSEKWIHTPGQMYPWVISYANGMLVWVETQTDARWENRNYSVIKCLDLKNNLSIKLSRKSRYLSAAISPDGSIISAVENTIENVNRLVLIDSKTGKILQSADAPDNAYLQHPQWAQDGEKITVIYLTEAGEGIMSYSVKSRSWDILIKAGREDFQSSFIRNDSLFFISSRSGTDNIYLLTPEKEIKCITRSQFGTSDLSIMGDNMVFSDYTAEGNSVSTTGIKNAEFTAPENTGDQSFLINRISPDKPAEEITSGSSYNPEPYQKWKHLFRFHSWMPFYADLEEIKSDPASIRPGLTVMTQNSLSTLISTVGYEYSQEGNNVIHSSIIWKGWLPVFETQIDYGDDPRILKPGSSTSNPAVIQPGLRLSNSVSIPLQFNSGKFSQYLYPSFTWAYQNNYIYNKDAGTYDHGQSILSGRLYFSNYHRSAIRDIYPRWAQVIDLNYTYAPYDKLYYGTSGAIKTAFYTPGLFPNNGIKFRFESEKQDVSRYPYNSKISFPRGYEDILSLKISFLSVDYVFPLIYPDFNVSSLVYIKRIRNGFFYDYASGTDNYYLDRFSSGVENDYHHKYNETFRSFGLELMADFYIFRIPYMISGGVQAAWQDNSNPPVFRVLFNIDLFGMRIGKRDL